MKLVLVDEKGGEEVVFEGEAPLVMSLIDSADNDYFYAPKEVPSSVILRLKNKGWKRIELRENPCSSRTAQEHWEMLVKGGGYGWYCPVCGQSFRYHPNMVRHLTDDGEVRDDVRRLM